MIINIFDINRWTLGEMRTKTHTDFNVMILTATPLFGSVMPTCCIKRHMGAALCQQRLVQCEQTKAL